ncbi:MAG: hypothetical protein UT17_C0005G0023 [Candidatus Woesebacteria bacterium GW2011_GWB1_39_10]|uniref:Uncharacterized protein n=1 Tax=Candidatus Woesebacteria bacterium GW2011_GWB1_39_10 TaxID=1618572 RepID=A0A0G0LUD8_9BACT|nr:MAG: hypothetical protein UT17_C0005G0023 [Candidatus Woesebacteria bacterium GW2011_GWB1_39_10]
MKKNRLVLVLVILIAVVLGVGQVFREKRYTTKGYATKVGFSKLTFSYHPGWEVTEDASLEKSFDKIKVSKNNYVININQELIAGTGTCKFKDSPLFNGPSRDFTQVKFDELDSNLGEMRYFKDVQTYIFCIKSTKEEIGYELSDITIQTPPQVNEKIFTEALDVIKSIKKVE